ncbi:MAG TPA: DUF1588 domain-containing protein [Polyangiaceae bacterium]|nr:DUF1588 domain-containing protein [Polyangiaceae bacterium]
MESSLQTAIACLGLGLLTACTGSISDPSGPASNSGNTAVSTGGNVNSSTGALGGSGPASTGSTSNATGGSPTAPGTGGGSAQPQPDAQGNLPFTPPTALAPALPARVWRLSHTEYQRSVKALVGVAPDISELPSDIDSGVYSNMSGTNFVRLDVASVYHELATTLTDALTTAQLTALIPCGSTNATCKNDFIQAAVTKAFRRPALAEDTTRYAAVFDAAVPSGDAALPFRSVLRALLTSPYFLYRTEIGEPAQQANPAFQLSNYEVASFLSYSLLGTPPSAELLASAQRGELTQPATLAPTLTAMLEQPAAAAQLATFLFQWIKLQNFADVTKFDAAFPGFEGVRAAMLDEARAFLAQTGMNTTLPGLLTGNVPATGALDQFYRSAPSAPAAAIHTGILELGATLALYGKAERSSPTLRGLFVRERLLCQHISLPPIQVPDISDTVERANPTTTRELYEMHASDPTCRSCHQLLDPVGFTLENLDGAGRFRTQENGVAINSSGVLLQTDVNGTYTSGAQLSEALSRSDWVRECVATQAFRFFFGQAEKARGLPPVTAGFRALVASGKMRDLLIALLSSPSTIERVRG